MGLTFVNFSLNVGEFVGLSFVGVGKFSGVVILMFSAACSGDLVGGNIDVLIR